MSEEKTVTIPVVGAGSAPGPRFFVCRYPEMKFTISPERSVRVKDELVKEKGIYAIFTKQVKPERFQGEGMLGSGNRSGTDKNDPLWWGVLTVSYPTPEQIKDVEAKRTRGDRLTPSERKLFEAKETIDFLREHEYYRKTVQDNAAESKPWMKELAWDPRKLAPGEGARLRARGQESIPEPGTPAPDDQRPAATKARVADMGGSKKEKSAA